MNSLINTCVYYFYSLLGLVPPLLLFSPSDEAEDAAEFAGEPAAIDAAALAVTETPEQIVRILRYVLDGTLT